jgi:hypothetical protein
MCRQATDDERSPAFVFSSSENASSMPVPKSGMRFTTIDGEVLIKY